MKNTQLAATSEVAAEEVIFRYFEQNIQLEKLDLSKAEGIPLEIFSENSEIAFLEDQKKNFLPDWFCITFVIEVFALFITTSIIFIKPMKEFGLHWAITFALLASILFLIFAFTQITNFYIKGNIPSHPYDEKGRIEKLLPTLSGGQKKKLDGKLRAAKMNIIARQKATAQKELLQQPEYVN